jgi:hypothetical protein
VRCGGVVGMGATCAVGGCAAGPERDAGVDWHARAMQAPAIRVTGR